MILILIMPARPFPKKALVCLSVILYLLATTASASQILKNLSTDPSEPGLEVRMHLVAELEGDTCSTELRFLIDNDSFGAKNIDCDKKNAESRDINPSKEGITCGTHTAQAVIYRGNEAVDNISRDVIIGKQPLITVKNPIFGSDVLIRFDDPLTGKPVQNIKVKIYNILNGKTSTEQFRTDVNGSIEFHPKNVGYHRLFIDEPDYCGDMNFSVKKEFNIAGPYPPNPRIGEEIKVIVPVGLGLVVLDETGKTYLAGNTSLDGKVNFTIDAPGNYTLAIGELSAVYVSKNVSIHVSEKPSVFIDITPEKAVKNKDVVIWAYSGNESLKNVRISISSPAKGVEEFDTDSAGRILYTPTSTGLFTVKMTNNAYQESNASFEVTGLLKADYSPKEPRTDEDITVQVRDEINNAAQGVTVSEGSAVLGYTGPDGKASFRLTEAGRHNISFIKQDHESSSIEINVTSPLSIELSSEDIELGQSITVKAFDGQNREVAADYIVTRPDGQQVNTGSTYTPDKAGNYAIKAQKGMYLPAEKRFKVRPRPVDITVELVGNDLLMNVSSQGKPVAGLHILVETAMGNIDAVTNSKGKTTAEINGEGEVRITANPGNINPDYGTAVKNKKIVKQREISSLLIVLAAIALFALIAAVLVYVIPKKGIKGRGGQQPRSDAVERTRAQPYFDSGGKRRESERNSILERKRNEYRHAQKKHKTPAEPYFSKKEGSSLSRK